MRDSWADVDTELRRRYDLIPNLVQVVEGYAAYENALLAALAQARATAMAAGAVPSTRQAPETAITGGLHQVLALGENNPQLKASRQFLLLQEQLAEGVVHAEILDRMQFDSGHVAQMESVHRVLAVRFAVEQMHERAAAAGDEIRLQVARLLALRGLRVALAYFEIDAEQAVAPQVPGVNDGRAA